MIRLTDRLDLSGIDLLSKPTHKVLQTATKNYPACTCNELKSSYPKYSDFVLLAHKTGGLCFNPCENSFSHSRLGFPLFLPM